MQLLSKRMNQWVMEGRNEKINEWVLKSLYVLIAISFVFEASFSDVWWIFPMFSPLKWTMGLFNKTSNLSLSLSFSPILFLCSFVSVLSVCLLLEHGVCACFCIVWFCVFSIFYRSIWVFCYWFRSWLCHGRCQKLRGRFSLHRFCEVRCRRQGDNRN